MTVEKQGYVYILASRRNGTLYIGVTSNLAERVRQHKAGEAGGFTSRYKVHRLVYFEAHARITDAIEREKRLKKWRRAWKIELIESVNPEWHDLFEEVAYSGRLNAFPRSRSLPPA